MKKTFLEIHDEIHQIFKLECVNEARLVDLLVLLIAFLFDNISILNSGI